MKSLNISAIQTAVPLVTRRADLIGTFYYTPPQTGTEFVHEYGVALVQTFGTKEYHLVEQRDTDPMRLVVSGQHAVEVFKERVGAFL